MPFDIKTTFPIKKVTYSIWPGKNEMKDYVKEEYRVRGMVVSKFMRGCYLDLAVYTHNRILFSQEIISLRRDEEQRLERLAELDQQLEEYLRDNMGKEAELKQLSEHVEKINEQIPYRRSVNA